MTGVPAEELETFRVAAQAWLEANAPRNPPPGDGPASRQFALDWQRTQYEGGWAGIAWPQEYGGRGLTQSHQLVWYEEYGRAGAPTPLDCSFVALNHAGPTLLVHGDEAQRRFHVPRILRGEALWCQGFSEPNAGSDLAGITTSARVEGDELVVSGQKIWTSFADVADYQELLVRTSREGRPHAGLTWVICDMRAPGITVRPIRNMAGVHGYCEVFYDDVRLPSSAVVGGLNRGWQVAMSTLGFERGSASVCLQMLLGGELELQRRELQASPPGPERDRALREVARLTVELAALRAMTDRMITENELGPRSSLLRLQYSQLVQRQRRLAFDGLGDAGLEFGATHGVVAAYLDSYQETIAGGTLEIQKNIIAERALGMPRGR